MHLSSGSHCGIFFQNYFSLKSEDQPVRVDGKFHPVRICFKLLLRTHCKQGASPTLSPQKQRFFLLFQGLKVLPQGSRLGLCLSWPCPAPGILGCSSPIWTVPARGAGSRRMRAGPAAALALPGVAVRPRCWSGASPGSDVVAAGHREVVRKALGSPPLPAVLALCSTASEVL